MPEVDLPLRRRNNFPYCGRLIVLESGKTGINDPFSGLGDFLSIDFPAMPDSVELARTVDYLVVNNQVMPDGIHQYKSTQPLVIPFSFQLMSFDQDFCPQGALSLLILAARLHSFALPIAGGNQPNLIGVSVAQTNPGEQPSNSSNDLSHRSNTVDSPYTINAPVSSNFFPPATLRLELIFIDENSPGIGCTGYVRDVRVKLNGPWMRGPGRSRNLPTSADFEFNFVHVPGYGNNFAIQTSTVGGNANMAQAFAADVKNRLYNTAELTKLSDRTFKGIGN